MVVNFFTILWYNPTLDQDCPSWVYASCAIGLFLYQTFDGVDGIQAYELPLAPLDILLTGRLDTKLILQAENQAERSSGRAV